MLAARESDSLRVPSCSRTQNTINRYVEIYGCLRRLPDCVWRPTELVRCFRFDFKFVPFFPRFNLISIPCHPSVRPDRPQLLPLTNLTSVNRPAMRSKWYIATHVARAPVFVWRSHACFDFKANRLPQCAQYRLGRLSLASTGSIISVCVLIVWVRRNIRTHKTVAVGDRSNGPFKGDHRKDDGRVCVWFIRFAVDASFEWWTKYEKERRHINYPPCKTPLEPFLRLTYVERKEFDPNRIELNYDGEVTCLDSRTHNCTKAHLYRYI